MDFDSDNSRVRTADSFGGGSYGDGDVPEIDTTPYHSDASDSIPEEMPARRSLGEKAK